MVYGNYLDEVLMVAGYYNYYYAHDHLYSPVALLSIDGGILERYEYDAYGRRNVFENDFDARSGSHYGLPIAFTGQRIDVLDGGDLEVMYYKNRYYDVEMGRFLNRDPIGYVDGMNLYQYVLSMPIYSLDTLGLIPHSNYGGGNSNFDPKQCAAMMMFCPEGSTHPCCPQNNNNNNGINGSGSGIPSDDYLPVVKKPKVDQIDAGELEYSCNCGWIDWNHAVRRHGGLPWEKIDDEKGVTSYRDNNYFGVMAYNSKWFSHTFFIKKGLSDEEKMGVALAIWQEVSEDYEGRVQGSWWYPARGSSFSEEDLSSNLISFYKRVKGFDNDQIREWCKTVGKNESMRMYMQHGMGKNRSWTPLNHNEDSCKCQDKNNQPLPMIWPSQLTGITPISKGTFWRDGAYLDYPPQPKHPKPRFVNPITYESTY